MEKLAKIKEKKGEEGDKKKKKIKKKGDQGKTNMYVVEQCFSN